MMNALDEELRYNLLKQLEQNPSMTQRELAEELGMSLGKTNYCLKSLLEKGWIKADNFKRNPKKLRYAYLLTPKGLQEKAQVTLRFYKQKQAEYEALEQQLEELRREAAELKPSKETE